MTGTEARRIRTMNHWSLQYLSVVSGINKPYLSEFENGLRTLSSKAMADLDRALNEEPDATPDLICEDGHRRLRFLDSAGNEESRPPSAVLIWTDDHGRQHRLYVGGRA